MKDENKSKAELINELKDLRQRVNELGSPETRIKKVTKSLQGSDEMFRCLCESSPMGIWFTDTDGRVLYTNNRWQEITGLTLDQSLGFGWSNALHPDDKKTVLGVWDRCLREEKGSSVEFRFISTSGNVKWVYTKTAPIHSETGQVIGFVGSNEDITERKRTEQALKESEERYRTLVETMNDGLGVQDEKEIITYANDTLCEMWGYSREEIVGHSVMTFLDEANRKVMKEQLKRRRKGGNEAYEIIWTRKDKQKISTLMSPSPLFDFDGNFKGSFAVITDVTGRKRAEEELHQLTQFQESIIDNANIWLDVLDTKANVLIWNKAAEEISGYSRDEVLGQGTIWEWLYPDREYRKEIIAKAASIIESGEIIEGFETTIRCKKGEKRVISWNSRNMVDEHENVVGSIALGRDITEQLQLEEQLRQSQKMEAVGQLAGGIAHDFNNLLTAMIGYSEILTRDLELDDKHRKYVGEIIKSADRAAKLTNQLLAFSRKQILKPKVLNLNRLVTDVEKMLMRLIGEDIRLVSKLEAGLGVIKADPGQLEQVIVNIAVNARDAMPGGGELTIETKNVNLDDGFIKKNKGVKAGRYVSLKISDSGTGMDEETRSRIFEPFFTTKEIGKGTGLGLSMVYGIVKQSGGYVFVKSKPNKGTEFSIYFPCVGEEDKSGGVQGEAKEIFNGSETILIVEDEEMVRKLIFESLKIFGYDLIEAENGEKALNVYKINNEKPIHLLITDMIMPDMGGWELAKELEKLMPDMKVLYISGYTDETKVHHGVLDEGVAFLQKPFSPQTLAKKVREILDAE